MPRHNEFEYIGSCVAVRGYTPGRRLNAYNIRGILFAFNGKQIPPGLYNTTGEKIYLTLLKGVLKTSSSDEVIVFYACTIFCCSQKCYHCDHKVKYHLFLFVTRFHAPSI